MQTPPSLHLPGRRRRTPWLIYIFLGIACLVGAGLITLILSFRMGDEARVMSRAVFAAAPGEWQRQFELGVGRLPVALARYGLSWIELDPRAEAGLHSFRCGDVGVYRRCGSARTGSGTVLANVRKAMERRGWESMVTVVDGDNAVAVFTPSRIESARYFRACVMVMDGDQLVVVSARANLEPLLELLHDSEPIREFREAPEKWLPSWINLGRGGSGSQSAYEAGYEPDERSAPAEAPAL